LKANPARRIGHRARFVDPDTGAVTWESLDASLTTVELREDWAVRKSKALAKRRLELEEGAPKKTGTDLEKAVERYFTDHAELRPRTIKSYRAAADKLLAWARRGGIKSADDLTRAKLLAFRASVVSEKKRVMRDGGKRGERKAASEPRGPHTINRELRSVRVVLGYLAELDLLPSIREGDLRRATKRIRVPSEHVEYLTPADLRRLFDACERHDAEMFEETREEHAGERPRGSTPRYDAIGPFVAFVLLTGMRFGEAIALEWRQVDLDALDHDGRAVGEIKLTAATKTHKARTVGLEVSPALRRLLAAMRLRNGGKGRVFAALTDGTASSAERRLKDDYGAPDGFTWQALRRTCGTFLTNAPGVYGAASAYHSARQLGHSVKVAETSYLGIVRGISRDARTLEDAMQIGAQMERVIGAAPRAANRLDGLPRRVFKKSSAK
jgi:integrase